ncbi:bacteriocin [Campylobacter helveticus]|uniref:bacteriocin n=1 Tax=Campylobacter helveticus TaxID=28898 RepID=UPI00214AB80D|nr:bacteriocin [Campylobacter helveticus]MCR2060531.1 bacteriocin [Campylobacter helveticus]
MFQKLFSIIALSALLVSFSFANDILAKLSNGAVSDNSVGVKVLSLDEMKEVRGGYYILDTKFNQDKLNLTSEFYLVANFHPGEVDYIKNYIFKDPNAKKGLCGLNVANCSNPSERRLIDYLDITNQSYIFSPTFIVKRQIKRTHLGQPYILFSYQVGVMDTNGQYYKFDTTTSSRLLKYNMIIKEMAQKYKSQIESAMGGYNTNVM